MSEATSATGATGEVRSVGVGLALAMTDTTTAADVGATRFHAEDGRGDNLCGQPFSFNDVIALGYMRPTCPDCLAAMRGPVRLVQSQRIEEGRVVLRVDVEGVAPPTLGDLTIAPDFKLRGALKPTVRYAAIAKWVAVTIQETDDGVRVEMHANARAGAFCAGLAWDGVVGAYVRADVPWWPAVVACEWGEEAPEVAA